MNKFFGYLVGIEGEILLGVGRSKKEALNDAQQNAPEVMTRRAADVAFFGIPTKRIFDEIESEGDGYKNNAFGAFGTLVAQAIVTKSVAAAVIGAVGGSAKTAAKAAAARTNGAKGGRPRKDQKKGA